MFPLKVVGTQFWDTQKGPMGYNSIFNRLQGAKRGPAHGEIMPEVSQGDTKEATPPWGPFTDTKKDDN